MEGWGRIQVDQSWGRCPGRMPALVPQQHRMAAEVPLQLREEAADLRAPDIDLDVQGQGGGEAAAARGDDQGAEARDLLVAPRADGERRGHPAPAPGAPEQGRHQKACFIETNQPGAEALEFFLLAAIPPAAGGGPVDHPALARLAAGAADSGHTHGEAGRYGRGDSGRRTAAGPGGRSAGMSTAPCDGRRPRALGEPTGRARGAGGRSASADGPEPGAPEPPYGLAADTRASSDGRTADRRPAARPPRAPGCFAPKVRWPGDADVRVQQALLWPQRVPPNRRD